MTYARKVFAKGGCVIYLAADIKCLDYHTPCMLVLKTGDSEYILSRGDVLLFRNTLKPYIQDEESTLQGRTLIFSSDDCKTYIYRSDACICMQIVAGDNSDVLCTVSFCKSELKAMYKAIDLRWYNRTIPVYR